MYIELIDLLRCPRNHEEIWLVAAFSDMDGRFVVDGKLGCPVCSASYRIENGIADLRDPAASLLPRVERATVDDDADLVMRIAAMLGLTRPNSLIALSGAEAILSQELSELTECRVVALDSAETIGDSEKVARVRAGFRIPLAMSSLDGLLITGSAGRLSDASRVLKPGGRLVANVGFPLPAGFNELARDEHYFAAESVGPIVTLSR